MPLAGYDPTSAFRFYLWNCSISEAFYLPLHFSEVACRNAINNALTRRCAGEWFKDPTFRGLLGERFAVQLDEVVVAESKRHGDRTSVHHVASALSFGFWEHLATKRFERFLWAKGLRHVFAFAPKDKTRDDLHILIESVRRWRNRIAHHQAIFDKSPMRKYQHALDLIRWACADTGTWVASISRVPSAIALRPQPK